MATAKLRKNPDETLYELTTPEGETFDPIEIEWDDPLAYFFPELNPEGPRYVLVTGECEGLKIDQLYQLVPVETIVEADADLEEDEDEAEELEAPV